jgi:hypothetical protein
MTGRIDIESDPAPSLLCRVVGHAWHPIAVDGRYSSRLVPETLELCRRCPASRKVYGDRVHR